MNCGAISYGDVLLLVDKIRQQITRSPGLGNGPFSYEALDVIADALFKATQLHGPNYRDLAHEAFLQLEYLHQTERKHSSTEAVLLRLSEKLELPLDATHSEGAK